MAKTYHYDVLLAHFGPNGERVSLLQRAGLLSGALAVVFYGHDMSRYPLRHGQDVYRDVLQDAELLLPISERWRGVLLEMGALPHKIAVQRMGVVPHDDFVHHLPEEGTPLLIAGVARLVPKKGMDDAIVALGHLGGALPFRFELIGDGPERARLEALALDHKVPVLFRGAQGRAEVQELLGRSHAFLAPSKTSADGDQEGIPVAIMEAMSAGLTVVTTRHSGIAELVADGETGFLADETAPEDLARTLLRAYEQRSRWREIQTQARAFVREHFDQTRWNHTLLERLSQLAERTRAQRS
jgi:colanic acid/amylovoran biosynthesis glycosyltransferase